MGLSGLGHVACIRYLVVTHADIRTHGVVNKASLTVALEKNKSLHLASSKTNIILQWSVSRH